MNIDEALYRYIKAAWTFGGNIHYGDANNEDTPYVVMRKISDPEQPEVLCENQGYVGTALIQFSGYKGGTTGEAASAASTMQYLEPIKKYVATIVGDIGSGGYTIHNNITTGVRLIEGNDTSIWGCIFETTIKWSVI